MFALPEILLVDNKDSFTYNLKDYLEQLGNQVHVVRSSDPALLALDLDDYYGCVISPGPGRPIDAGFLIEFLSKWIHVNMKTPMLGICLGLQAIGRVFDLPLVKAKEPRHGKTSLISLRDHWMWDNLPTKVEVMRYHSLILRQHEKSPLQTIAVTESDEIMAIAHKNLPLIGLQFHPESILTENGLRMLANWLEKSRLLD